MNTKVVGRELFRRPQQTVTESSSIGSDLRRVASHGAHFQRQGRPTADVQDQGLLRLRNSLTGQRHQNHGSRNPSYPVMGTNAVQAVRYTEPKQSSDKGLVWINQKQYFKNVPPEVWNFSLGGSQICQKWLKDREGRSLSGKDIQHYQRIVVALKEMIELMAGIDAAIQNRQFKPEEKLSIAAHH